MVIVKNLGVDILIGEPGKKDNRILTHPHKRMIELQPIAGKKTLIPYFIKSKVNSMIVFPCKSDRKMTVYPGHFISVDLPTNMKHIRYVSCVQSQAQ